MYIPDRFAASGEVIEELLSNGGAADLITSTPSGLLATFLPFIFDPHSGEYGALLRHVARNNPQWRTPTIGDALVIVHGPDAYISPSWVRHDRTARTCVVPTWNYVTAHVYGELVVHDDAAWVESLVRGLTERHEAAIEHNWSVDDAPPRYIAGQLRAIVGVEIRIHGIEAKAKLSQNRSAADVRGVIAGLEALGDLRNAAAVRNANMSTVEVGRATGAE